MRITIIFLITDLFLIMPFSIQAQHEYQPFLKLGKKWHCQGFQGHNVNNNDSYWIDYYYEVREKVEKGDAIYYNIVCDNSDNYYFDYWFREDGGKVYRMEYPGLEEIIIYDFLPDERETFSCQVSEDMLISLTNKSKKEELVCGIIRYIIDNEWIVSIDNSTIDGENSSDVYNMGVMSVVEGIGNLMNPFDYYAVLTDMYPPKLIECFEGETCIFSIEDYQKMTTSIKSTYKALNKKRARMSTEFFDLSGRIIPTEPSKGLFIKNERILLKR